MILYQQTSWKNTVAFRISFDLRNLNIHQTHPALLHFAEHLMFIATKKLNERALYEKKTFFFDFLGAYTTPLYMCINVTCAQSDLKTVGEVLHEMIYAWKCNAKQFNKEKEEILAELANYELEATTQAVNTLATKDPEFKTIAIGNKKTLTALKYTDLKKIKEAWQIMLHQAPASLVVASGNLNPTEKKILENITDFKKSPITIPPIPFTKKFLSIKNVNALQFKTTASSPFYLFLQRVYFIRLTNTNPTWYFEFVREKHSLNYLAYKGYTKNFNKVASKKFLLAAPTKNEFHAARKIIIKHLESLQDGINPQELIDWLDTFQDFIETKHKNLTEISKLFRSYSFQIFSKKWKQNFKILKK